MQLIELGDTRVVQIRPDDSIDHAIDTMEEYGFRHLPVVERGVILGMVSDRDLISAVGLPRATAEGPARVGDTPISEVMTSPAHTVEAEAPLEEAAKIMLAEGIHAVPLVFRNHIAGIVTGTDFLRCYLEDRPVTAHPEWRDQLAGDHMTHPVITLPPDATFLEALRMMQSKRLRHLPISEDDRLIGIVSDRDMRQVIGQLTLNAGQDFLGLKHHSEIAMRDVMTTEVETTTPAATLAEVASHLVNGRFGSLPVVDGESLTGIITEADLLRLFVEACDG